MTNVSLAAARRGDRLIDFIRQEEARGIGPIDRSELDGAVAQSVKEPRPEDQTSRSASAGNSSGKRTRRGSGPDASS
jgi:hypothetical protein